MENIRSIINEATAKGYDISIYDGFYYIERNFSGKGWHVVDEFGWFNTEEEIDEMKVIEYTYDDRDEMVFITVEKTKW